MQNGRWYQVREYAGETSAVNPRLRERNPRKHLGSPGVGVRPYPFLEVTRNAYREVRPRSRVLWPGVTSSS
jgi:hypothetical protein